MDVIRHDHEFVQKIFPLVAIVRQHFEQKIRRRLAPEDWLTLRGDRGDEENSLAVHLPMLRQTLLCASVRDVTIRLCGFQDQNTGSEGLAFLERLARPRRAALPRHCRLRCLSETALHFTSGGIVWEWDYSNGRGVSNNERERAKKP